MNPFINELANIRRENDNNIFNIRTPQIRAEVKRIASYLSSSSLSLFQAQIVYKDLIDIGTEAEKEGITLEEKLGVDVRTFCNEVIENGGTRSRLEHCLTLIVSTLQCIAWYLPLSFFGFNSAPVEYHFLLSDLISLLALWIGFIVIEPYVRGKFSLQRNPFVRNGFPILFIAIFLVVYVCNRLFSGTHLTLFTCNGWILVSIAIVIAVAATIGMNFYWHRCAREYTH